MITSVQLSNFRSYKEETVYLSKNINVFIGKNGQGKTNLLEAIYYISNIRSHRTRNDNDLIKVDSEYSRIIVNIEKNSNNEKLMCVIHQKGKYFSINNNVVSKTSDMLGRINTVLFYPNETRIFSDSPATRRNFFDVEIGKVSKDYLNIFQQFNKLLKDRNKILKEKDVDLILLEIVTNNLIDKQLSIIKEREHLTQFINNNFSKYFFKFTDNKFKVKMVYKSSLKDLSKDEIKSKYEKNIDRDKFNGITTEGIHRDDYEFLVENIEISKYLSQGQLRLVLLAIKFVIIDYIIHKTNQKPILLLDDVFSELDSIHQQKVLDNIPKNIQTIITTTDNYEIFHNKSISKYKINNSNIFKKEDFDAE